MSVVKKSQIISDQYEHVESISGHNLEKFSSFGFFPTFFVFHGKSASENGVFGQKIAPKSDCWLLVAPIWCQQVWDDTLQSITMLTHSYIKLLYVIHCSDPYVYGANGAGMSQRCPCKCSRGTMGMRPIPFHMYSYLGVVRSLKAPTDCTKIFSYPQWAIPHSTAPACQTMGSQVRKLQWCPTNIA